MSPLQLLHGSRPIGRLEQLCRERQERDLEKAESRGLYYDPDAGERVVQFFRDFLVHFKGEWAGQALELTDDQADHVIRPLFGWRREDGTRRFREAYIEIPRKWGKSTVGAGVGLYLTIADDEPGGEVYSAATKRDQSRIVFDAARRMAKASSRIEKHVDVGAHNISCARLGSKFEPLSADHNTLDGLGPSGLIIDELHAHKSRHLYDVLLTGMGARRQPLAFMITTAGIFDKELIGWQMHSQAVQILEQQWDDDAFFVYIAAADEGDDWEDPLTWWKANPNLGVTPKLETIAREAEKAKRQTSYLNTFLRYHTNLWTQQWTRWISLGHWDECGAAPSPARAERVCFGGLDLASKVDIAAFALLWHDPDDEMWDIEMRFWVPEDRVTDRAKTGLKYQTWADQGLITLTSGLGGVETDFAAIRKDILDLNDEYFIGQVGYDAWNALDLAQQLERSGMQMLPVVQGYQQLSEPSKQFEALVLGKRIRHGGNAVLRWMAANVVKREDVNGNIRPDKKKSLEKIDGIVAVVNALNMAIRYGDAGEEDRYEVLTLG